MKKITVFLGSREAHKEIYNESVIELAEHIAKDGNTLLYGGANVGTMKLLADTCLKYGGEVIGIMPRVLIDKELVHPDLTQSIFVKDMSKRKQELELRGDIFVAMPGGAGTMDEIFEVITNYQIGIHNKPACFINIDGIYNGIKIYLKDAMNQNFISKENYDRILFYDSVEEFINSDIYKGA